MQTTAPGADLDGDGDEPATWRGTRPGFCFQNCAGTPPGLIQVSGNQLAGPQAQSFLSRKGHVTGHTGCPCSSGTQGTWAQIPRVMASTGPQAPSGTAAGPPRAVSPASHPRPRSSFPGSRPRHPPPPGQPGLSRACTVSRPQTDFVVSVGSHVPGASAHANVKITEA